MSLKEVAIVPPEKELKEYKSQVSFVQKAADDLVVASKEDLDKGAELLNAVIKVEKVITERKNAITKPLMASLASIRDLFKPLEAGPAEAKKTIKGKMLDYTIAEEERVEKEKSRVEARVEKGTMRTDTAIKKLEGIGDAPKTNLRKVTKVRIVDETLIPREYLVPDMQKIQDAVLKQKLSVPGVETYEEKSIVGSSR